MEYPGRDSDAGTRVAKGSTLFRREEREQLPMEPVSHQIPWALPSHLETSIPDLLAPVVAFRDWRVTEEGLCSARLGTPWPEPILEATCLPQRVEHVVLPA